MIGGWSAPRRIVALCALVCAALAVALPVDAQSTESARHEVPFPDPQVTTGARVTTTSAAKVPRPPLDEIDLDLPDPASATALHVKFGRGVAVSIDRGRLRGLPRADRLALESALEAADAELTPLFSRSRAALDADRRRAERTSGVGQVDLSQWFRVTIGNTSATTALLEVLNGVRGVEAAIAEPTLASAAVAQPAPSVDYVPNQDYRRAGPVGVDADYAATIAGGTGANVVVSDLEYSWNTTHEDLAGALGAELVNGVPDDPFSSTDHGTAVIGIIGAEDNGFGLTGLAHDAELQLVNVFTTSGAALADAIDLAAANSDPGDVLLVEQQLCPVTVVGGFCGPGWLPVEWFPSFYDAIVAAANKGIIVIEAAGNGSRDLDDELRLPDSGAILVGAGNPSDSCSFFDFEPARGRLDFSNWGTRVDLQGHGACVWSTGAEGGELVPSAPEDEQYTALFSGTSAGAAVVAGAAASLSSIAIENGDPLGAAELRALLRATGSAQDLSADPRPIGPLPDLRAAVDAYLASPHGAPTNDAFEAPTVIDEVPAAFTQVTGGASVQVGEPISTCGSSDTTIWYTVTPPGRMSLRFAAERGASGPSLAVWEIVGPDVLAQVECSIASTAGPTTLDARLEGGVTYMIQLGDTGGFPVSLSVGGLPDCDLDGDGFGDVLIGAPGERVRGKAGAGAVNVLYGHSSDDPERAPVVTQASTGVPGRPERGDGFGTSVACGDVNGDGFDDAVVGVPGERRKRKDAAGAVQVLYGSPDGLRIREGRITQASGKVPGKPERRDRFGEEVAVGDVDGDGYHDIVVGAPNEGIGGIAGAGAVTVLYGGADGVDVSRGSIVHQNRLGVPGTVELGERVGESLAVADTNSDGRAEIFIGVPRERFGAFSDVGAVIVVPGSATGPAIASSWWIAPTQANISTEAVEGVRFGAALAAGDVNGDGHDDLVIGTPGSDRPGDDDTRGGWVDIVPGSAQGLQGGESYVFRPGRRGVPGKGRAGDAFGAALALADVDGSGAAELYIGAPGKKVGGAANAGAVIRIDLTADYRVTDAAVLRQGRAGMAGAAQPPDRFGSALISRDIDADGFVDLVIGASGDRVAGDQQAGQVVRVPGSVDGLELSRSLVLHQDTPGVANVVEANDHFGGSLG